MQNVRLCCFNKCSYQKIAAMSTHTQSSIRCLYAGAWGRERRKSLLLLFSRNLQKSRGEKLSPIKPAIDFQIKARRALFSLSASLSGGRRSCTHLYWFSRREPGQTVINLYIKLPQPCSEAINLYWGGWRRRESMGGGAGSGGGRGPIWLYLSLNGQLTCLLIFLTGKSCVGPSVGGHG